MRKTLKIKMSLTAVHNIKKCDNSLLRRIVEVLITNRTESFMHQNE